LDHKLLLAKGLTLLYRESQLKDKHENSADLVRTVLQDIQVSEIGIGIIGDRETIISLKTTVLEMCGMTIDHEYDITEVLQRVRLNCGNDDRLYEAIRQGIEPEMTEASIKRTTTNIKKALNNHFKEKKLEEVISKASTEFKFRRDKIKDTSEFIANLISQLEPLQLTIGTDDSAVIDDIDIGNEDAVRNIFTDVLSMNSGMKVYKTGWPALNRALQGGFRPGEFWMFGALQHKYKTGVNMSLFAQLAMFNRPHCTDPTKKPLLLRISFEDAIVNNLQFLYQYIKYSETREYVDVNRISVDEMTAYVKDKLQATGFHVKMMRVDPDAWTYKSLCNKIIELESQGYYVEGVFLDYAYKISKVGLQIGPAGTEVLDLISKLRGFFSSRKILCVTPHQISTEGKALLNGMTGDQYVKELAGRGYFEGSKGLDRIVDGLVWTHLFRDNKKTYLGFQLDKHRFPTVTEEENKFFMMQFPSHRSMPIPHGLNDEDESFKKISAPVSNASDDLFKF
jgi:hypothetical protein